eukprot:SAG11_NODE_16209_length_554_cov_1.347253_1_plen_63_part_10
MKLGGVNEEIFDDSAVDGVNSHCVNTVFGMRLMKPVGSLKMDAQNDEMQWFGVNDPSLHPFIQ